MKTAIGILFVLYVLLGPAAWAALGLLVHMSRRRMMILYRPHLRIPQPPPRATILIPAKDEGQRIGECLRTALAQTYPNYSVVAIDDRSTDQTGRVMDQIAASDPRLRVVHVKEGELPSGWTGKCNALWRGVREADGQWLLFVDSDVVIAPDALAATLATTARRHYDTMTLWPKVESHSFWEGALVPLAAASTSVMYAVILTNKDHLRKAAFANGQFLLMSRSAYDEIGGHAAVKDQFCEDVEIARLLKARGKRVRIAWGIEWASVRMYSSLAGIIRGWGRIFYAVGLGRPWRILLGMLFILLCSLSAYPVAAAGVYLAIHGGDAMVRWGWLAAGTAHLLAMTVSLAAIYAWSGNRKRYALAFPAAAVMLLATFAKALWSCVTRRIEWRGTRYSHALAPSDPATHASAPCDSVAMEQGAAGLADEAASQNRANA